MQDIKLRGGSRSLSLSWFSCRSGFHQPEFRPNRRRKQQVSPWRFPRLSWTGCPWSFPLPSCSWPSICSRISSLLTLSPNSPSWGRSWAMTKSEDNCTGRTPRRRTLKAIKRYSLSSMHGYLHLQMDAHMTSRTSFEMASFGSSLQEVRQSHDTYYPLVHYPAAPDF